MSGVAPDPLDHDVDDAILETLHRPHEYVPLNLYDEVTKLAEYALRDLLVERRELVEIARAARLAATVNDGTVYGREQFAGAMVELRAALARLDKDTT